MNDKYRCCPVGDIDVGLADSLDALAVDLKALSRRELQKRSIGSGFVPLCAPTAHEKFKSDQDSQLGLIGGPVFRA